MLKYQFIKDTKTVHQYSDSSVSFVPSNFNMNGGGGRM